MRNFLLKEVTKIILFGFIARSAIYSVCIGEVLLLLNTRVCTGHGKPGKSWNFVVAFSRTGKSWKKAADPGKFWKSVKLKLKI